MSSNKNIPTILVVFGATGDLIKKKIVPSLFSLSRKKRLPTQFKVVGFSRREMSDGEFREYVADIIAGHFKLKPGDGQIEDFLGAFSYKGGDFGKLTDYKSLAGELKRIDEEWGMCTNKLFYLAVPPKFYEQIFKNLSASGLTVPCGPNEGWTRVIVEKPFGKDLKTAKELDVLLGKLFKEVQIYRIDHYLAKEMLQNILTFRFSNNLFEGNWGKQLIEKIEIRMLEKLGVEDRGSFYDGVGALRDVGQNHLLQILALVTMEHPMNFTADAIRSKRSEILKLLKKPLAEEVKKHTFRAQYDGYKKIKDVAKNSKTETYFKILGFLDLPRWEGVPVTFESGKRLGDPVKEIIIYFKHPSPCLCPPAEHYENKITIQFEPKEEINISFWSKIPGFSMDLEKKNFNFLLRAKEQSSQYTEEYEKLILDCIAGDQTLFVSTEEIQAMWSYIDPIIGGWRNNAFPLHKYSPDSRGITEEAEKFVGTVANGKILKKEIGIIGLGKMGGNIARRLLDSGWRVVGYNRSPVETKELEKAGMLGSYSPDALVSKLNPPRLVWLMVPAGKPVDDVIFGKEEGLINYLKKGDVIIDGGNSFYKDSVRRSSALAKKGIGFLDIGVSGGPAGARYGASLMIGGEKRLYDQFLRLFEDISVADGYSYMGKSGAGHFVKMIHNGIEYGMMQAIAEGFTVLKRVKYKLDLAGIAEVYNHGSVIESRLVGWLKNALKLHGGDLNGISGSVAHTGEGDWTVKTAKELGIKARIIEESLNFRILSEKNPSYTGKVLSALRGQFGGHQTSISKKIKNKK